MKKFKTKLKTKIMEEQKLPQEAQKESRKLSELLEEKHLTIIGKFTIPQLTNRLGLPKAILKYAKVEARTGLTSNPTIQVERFVDGELFYSKDIVIRGISKSLILQVDHNGISVEYVRHPTYNAAKMPKATEKEICSLR